MGDKKIDLTRINFTKYLDSLGLSPKSHKNYRSDLTHFTNWVILKIRSFGSYIENLTEAIPFLNSSMASEYKSYLVENNTSSKTVNRRLSTLRHLSRFLVASQIIDFDFTNGLQNISTAKKPRYTENAIVNDFKSFLEAEKASRNTIKNYVSDVRQFLAWLETNHETANPKA